MCIRDRESSVSAGARSARSAWRRSSGRNSPAGGRRCPGPWSAAAPGASVRKGARRSADPDCVRRHVREQ
eukprot:2591319-Alexandrium_andersonii.AAC.1